LTNHHQQACLTENPKSYSTWHHRKWVVLQGHADLQREMKLVNRCVSQICVLGLCEAGGVVCDVSRDQWPLVPWL
jgi:hypothetical protein